MNKVDVTVESNDEVDLSPVKRKYDQFANGLVSDMKTMGDKAGKNFTEGIASGMEKASSRVVAAQAKQQNAVDKLRIAQQRLLEVQENQNAKASQRMSAEHAFEMALRAVQAATDDVAAAERNLADEREKMNASPVTQKSKVDFDLGSSMDKIKGQALSELKSTGIQAGAVFAGALAAGISSVGAAGLFVGIAAAAQSQNDVVRAAYKDLWETIKQGATETSASLAPEFIAGAERLGRTFNALKPELTEGFVAAKPVIHDFFDGIDRGVQTAMPGLVTGAKSAKEATNGLADMMDSAGRGVSNFFTEASKGAPAAGDAFRSFGKIVERLGSFAGRIFAQLANNSSTVLPALEGAIDSAAGAIENLASTALPSLASGASFALSGLGLLLNLASSLISVLGPLVPAITSFATALKLVDMVSFGGVGRSWNEFKTSIGDAEGVFGKVKAGATGLVTTLGPVALAAGLVTVGLGYLAAEQQEAAKETAAHAKRVDILTDALRASNGVINDSVRASAADALSKMNVNKINKDMLTGARELNINQRLLTDAYMGNSDALGKINHELDTIMSPYKDYNDMVKRANPEEQKRWMLAELMKDTLNKQGGEFQTAAAHARDYANAMGESANDTNILSEAFKTLRDDAASAEQKIQALVEIMDVMAGRKPDVEAATSAWEKFLDTFNKKDGGFESGIAGTKKWASALVDAQGHINLTTEDGRKLLDMVKDAEKDFATMAQAMSDSGASQDEVTAKLATMRQSFIDVAMKMGFTQTQAENLANAYGLVPSNVSTLVNSNLAPELQKALSLGGTIRSLPDGYFVVTANTSQAQNTITKFVQDNQGHVITVKVNTVTGAQTNTVNTPGGGRSSVHLKAGGGPAASVMAAAGGARTGIITVNEAGQESANLPNGDKVILPTGSQVNPHAGNRDLAAAQAPIQLMLSLDLTGIEGPFTRMLADWFRKGLRVSGKNGNVNAWVNGRAA